MNYTFNRRYKKELELISNNYKNIKIYEKDIIKNIDKIIEINLLFDNYNIIILLDEDYPFYPPKKININNLDVNCYINSNITLLLKKYFDVVCIKCESLLCENKWNPTCKLINIVNEQIKYYNYINSIRNILEIKKKIYINDDILLNIFEFIKEN